MAAWSLLFTGIKTAIVEFGYAEGINLQFLTTFDQFYSLIAEPSNIVKSKAKLMWEDP